MTLEEWNAKYVYHGLVETGAPVYLDEDQEARRVAWVKWRNRLVGVLMAIHWQDNASTRDANKIMETIWPFPEGTRAR